jgi:hypothetical protein
MASYTSILSYRQLIISGLDVKESEIVFNLLKVSNRPLTSREISMKTGIERTNITRTLFDLVEDQKVKVSKLDKCPITKKLVKYYTLND